MSCFSSTSEAEESDANADENAEPSQYYCRHCFTTDSKDWHHAGKSLLIVKMASKHSGGLNTERVHYLNGKVCSVYI